MHTIIRRIGVARNRLPISTLFFSLLLLVNNLQAADDSKDTLRVYNLSRGVATYDSIHSSAFAARFSSLVNVTVHGVRIVTRGLQGAKARVRLFGGEGGSSVPTIEQDLVEPIWARAENDRMDTIAVEFDPPIVIHDGQFFVCIDSIAGMRLLTDRDTVVPECICPTDRFVNQCVKSSSGEWTTGSFSFLIEPIVSVDRSVSRLRFEIDTLLLTQRESTEEFSLVVADFNMDDHLDIVVGSYLVLGPLTHGNVSANIRSLHEIDASMLDISLVSTIRSKSSHARVVGIKASDRLDALPWNSGLIEGVTLKLPMSGRPVFSLAITSVPVESEVLIVAERSQDVSSFDRDQTVEKMTNDKVHVVAGITSAIRDDVLQVPDGQFVQSGYAVDVDRDGDLDLLIACTNHDGRLSVFTSTNTNGIFSELIATESFQLPLVARPVLSRIQSLPQNTLGARIDDGDIVVTYTIETHNTPHLTSTTLQHLPLPSDNRSEQRDIGLHDRLSAISCADLDGDGADEVIATSEDTCRKTALYRLDEQKTYERVFGTGIESLSGSPDLACVDIDADHDADAIGLVDNKVIFAWNCSPQVGVNSKRVPIPTHFVRTVSVAEAHSRSSILPIRAFWGGGRNIHIRDTPAILIGESDDTIVVIRRMSGGQEYIDRFSAESPIASIVNSDPCRVRITPNPFFSEVQIGVSDADGPIESCTIMNSAGEVVWSASILGSEATCTWDGRSVNGSPIANGTYTIHIKTRSCSGASRVMKVQ